MMPESAIMEDEYSMEINIGDDTIGDGDISSEGASIPEEESFGSDLDQKVIELENTLSIYATEITLLKSALSNALSRLSVVEDELKKVNTTGKTKKDSSSKPTSQIKRQRPKSLIEPRVSESCKDENNNNLVPDRKSFPSPTKETSRTKYNRTLSESSGKNAASSKPKRLSRTSSKDSNRESFDDKDDGKPKIMLAKKVVTTKKTKASISSPDENNPKSPKDETVKFWIRGRGITLYPPTGFQEDSANSSAPDKNLELQWVYGYRGKDCRDNLFHLASGDVVYNVAGVIILYNKKTKIQRHYTKHTDDVKCLAVHPNGTYIASGQVAGHGDDKKPHVQVWDSTTLETLKSFGHGTFERGLCVVKFSTYENGKYLVGIDESNDHVIYIYNWEKGTLITETKASKEPVLGAKWNPCSELAFATYGKSHLIFWTWNLDPVSLTKKAAIYEKLPKPKFVQTIVYTDEGDLVAGDSNGNILMYKNEGSRNRVTGSVISAHNGGVFCLCYLNEKGLILSSGRDGQFSLWNKSLEKLSDLAKISEQYGPSRCIVYSETDNTYVVATSKNCILQYSNDEMTDETALVVGHYDEMWGLATHPTKPLVATCAQDQLVCVWNSEENSNVWNYLIEEQGECAAFHPTLDYFVVGTKTGSLHFLNYATFEEEITTPVSRDCVSDVKISPDGKYFAAACRDTKIYLYAWPDDLSNIKKPTIMQGHSSRVLHLDWSTDSEYLQSNSSDYEILFWQREAGLQVVSAAALRDVSWATWTCPFGFPAQGIWPEGADGTDINACARSEDNKYIATGDDFGEVKVFRYPSVKLKADASVGTGHSSHVTCVRFLANDSGLMTVGGQDCSIMQWKLV